MSQNIQMLHIIIFAGDLSRKVCGRGWQKLPQGEMYLGPLKKPQIFPGISGKAAWWRRAGASPAISTAGGCSTYFFQRSHLVKKQFFHYKLDGKPGRLTQRKSAILTRWKPLVQIQYRLPANPRGLRFEAATPFHSRLILLPIFGKSLPGLPLPGS